MNNKNKRQFGRRYNIREEIKKIFIFSEGQETEPNYFEAKKKEIEEETRKRNIEIRIKGTGYNTLSLVDYAIKCISDEGIDLSDLHNVDECWVVFDKDSFKDFNNAIEKARANNLKVAYSNECFELWFLLHFDLCSSALSRDSYKNKLTDRIQCKYEKNLKDMYSRIQHLENNAIKNAKKLLEMHKEEPSNIKRNPSTTVHLLVESLNNLKEIE